MLLNELHQYCNRLLSVHEFDDYCPNGMQVQSVEGSHRVSKIVTGVTASQALVDRAVELKADALLVHHGYFWRGEPQQITGIKARRIRALMQNHISLLAYHLPLDAHPKLGNNAQLAKLLGISIDSGLDDGAYSVGNVGVLSAPMSLRVLSERITERLEREPLIVGDAEQTISSVAWCTGAAQSYIEKAAERGVDCFISGEVSESTVHMARELGVAYIAAGHHATERYGVKALGEHLAEQFAVDVEFVDIDNPA